MDKEIIIKHYEVTAHPRIKRIGVRLSDENHENEITVSTTPTNALAFGLQLAGVEIPVIFLHDVVHNIVQSLGAKILKVLIYDLIEQKFLAHIYLDAPKKNPFPIDICITDALAIAMRAGIPVYILESVIQKSRDQKGKLIPWYDLDKEYTLELLNNATQEEIKRHPPEEIQIFLEKAINAEDYELAKKIKSCL